MTRWLHKAGSVREAATAVREIVRLVELLACVSEALPAPATDADNAPPFRWPDGRHN